MRTVKIEKGTIGIWNGNLVEVYRPNLVLGLMQVTVQDSGEIITIPIGKFTPTTQEYQSSHEEESREQSKIETEENILLAKKRYSAITAIMSAEGTKKRKIDLLCRKLNLSRAGVYNLIKKYDGDIGPVSLLKEQPGPREGFTKISPEIESLIKYAIKAVMSSNEKFSHAEVLRLVDEMCSDSGIKTPSQGTITKRIMMLSDYALSKRKIGRDKAADKYEPRVGKLLVERPLDFVQIDHTLVDIQLLDTVSRKPIGRPWLTIAICVFTRVILGFHLSLGPPSRYSVACCVAHAALTKDDWLESIGAGDISYPFYGVPRVIHADNASEFRSSTLERACAKNNIDMQWRKRKHYGGHIERLIGTIMTRHIHFLPGTTRSNPSDLGEYNSEKEAIFTFAKFREVFAREVDIYHRTLHSAIGKSPRNKWIEYFTDADGQLTHPPLVTNPRDFKIDFMPDIDRTVCSSGVSFENFKYWNPAIRGLIGKKVLIKYNPEALSKIWVLFEGRYIDLLIRDLSSIDLSLGELKLAKRELRKLGKKPTDKVIFEQAKLIRERIATEKENTKAARRMAEQLLLQKEHILPSQEDNFESAEKEAYLDSYQPTPLHSEIAEDD